MDDRLTLFDLGRFRRDGSHNFFFEETNAIFFYLKNVVNFVTLSYLKRVLGMKKDKNGMKNIR